MSAPKRFVIEANWSDLSGPWNVIGEVKSEDPTAAFDAMKSRAVEHGPDAYGPFGQRRLRVREVS